MKKISIITVVILSAVMWGCGGVKREPSLTYMPDMAYSRAYETYASTAELDSQGINYTRLPVPGTIKRGELFPFPYGADKVGDSTNYVASKQVENPLDSMDATQLKEGERLYLVNCGICHGTNLDGNGPLYNGGNGPYAAAPKNLITLDMPDGQMFYSITYGKGQMGPYGPQLNTTQRWMVINYIRSKQAGGGKTGATSAATDTSAKAAPADTTKASN